MDATSIGIAAGSVDDGSRNADLRGFRGDVIVRPEGRAQLAKFSGNDNVRKLTEERKFAEAIEAADKLVSDSPDSSDAYLVRAIVYREFYFFQAKSGVREYGVPKNMAKAADRYRET